jgi:hypothetical protein
MMDLSSVIGSFNQGPLTMTRVAAGGYVSGSGGDGPSSPVVFDPSVVLPLRGRELEVLPEGLRTRMAVQVFTVDPPQVTSETAGTKGDRFTWGGNTFEVQLLDPWGPMANYHRSVATKVDLS